MYPFSGKLRISILLGICLTLFLFPGIPANAAPNIISIDPTFGTQGDLGLQVNIFGSGFELGPGNIPPAVQFGSGADGISIVPPVIFIDQFNLTVFIDINIATIPQLYTLWVVNQSDLQQDSLFDAFNVLPKPLIYFVNPDHGFTGDTSLPVVITGQYLDETTSALFGSGIVVDSIDSVSPTEVQCTISIDWMAAPGFRDVSLFSELPLAELQDGFEVVAYPAPNITGVDPPDICFGDDINSLTVFGTGFIDGIGFNFAPLGIIITNTNYISPSEVQLTVFLGGAPIDIYSLACLNPDGQSDILNPAFEIKDCTPVVQQVIPDTGYPGDTGLAVTIHGLNFNTAYTVDFGADITVTDFNIISDTRIDAVLDIDPLAPLGPRNVQVTNDYGSDTLQDGFTIIEEPIPPEILEVNPGSGNQGDISLPVAISGNYLADVTTVDFGPGITVTFIDATDNLVNVTLDINIAATPGFRDVTVSGITGSDTLFDGFEVIETIFPPEIIAVNPDNGTQGDTNLPVTITGNYLSYVTSVDFGPGITVNFISATANAVNVTLDIDIAATLGFRDVTVSGNSGDDTLFNGFEVLELIYPPEITAVNPDTGYQGDTMLPVAISGNYLSEIINVDFGLGITVSFVDASPNLVNIELDIDVTAAPGFRDVTVIGTNGEDTLTNGFEVLSSSPIIDSVVPDQGMRGTSILPVTITGQNLLGVDTVDFGSGITVALGTVTDISIDVLLTIDMDAALGARDVTVTNNLLLSDTLSEGFTVTDIPVSQPNIISIDPNIGYPGDTNLIVEIVGTDFMDGITADFGTSDITVSNVQFNDSTSITATIDILTGSTPGQYGVTVDNPDGGSDLMINGFEIIALPTIAYIDPDHGYPGDTLPFQLRGDGFKPGATFYVDPPEPFLDITYQVDSETLISGTIVIDPLASPGLIDLYVENPDGKIAAALDGFEILPIQPEDPFIESIIPNSAYQGDSTNFQVHGGNFQTGAILEFPGLEGFMDLTYDVDSPDTISGSMNIDTDAPLGVYDVRVTNPDERSAALQNGFTVLEKIVEELSIDTVFPDQLCRGVVTEVVVQGNAFEIGSLFTFEISDAPYDFVSVQSATFVSPNEYRLLLDVDPDAPEGFVDIRVDNPDERFAYGPRIEIIECGFGRLLWQESLLDIVINQEGFTGTIIEGTGSATIQNVGDVAFEDIIIGMTDLVSPDGRKITPENVEIYPSVLGELGPGHRELIEVRFTIPVSEDLITSGGGVYMGSMVAKDSVTGDSAALPVSVTILSAGRQVIEIDPLCLQVDLYNPGLPASQVPDLFEWLPDNGTFPSEIVANMGGCVDPFPVFEWSVYADGCPGYNETWIPTYTLTIYPLYPSQSPESAMSNNPVWRIEGLDEDFIQYSYPGEQLSGLYLWQLEVVPKALPGLAVDVLPINPVLSDIWVFCVETDNFQEPPAPEIQGEILWVPDQLTINGAGKVRDDLVLSDRMVSNIGDDPVSISILDESGNSLVTWEGNLSVLQLSYDSPMPDFGPVTIPFGINLTPISEIGPSMSPADFALQFYNGRNLICETDLRNAESGRLTGYAYIGGSEDSFEIDIVWPWEEPCWETWVQWWEANTELDQDCTTEWDALEYAESALDAAKADYDTAEEEVNVALTNYIDKFNASQSALADLTRAEESCENFFTEHISSDLFSFSQPDPGWSSIEVFGGQVRVWYKGDAGAEAINNAMDEFSGEYNALWDALRAAQAANDRAQAEFQNASEVLARNKSARDEAANSLNSASGTYNQALAELNACLQNMNSLREIITNLELSNPDCFWWYEGVNTSGAAASLFYGGSPGSSTGDQAESSSDAGTNGGPCPCEDCDEEYAAMLETEQYLNIAQAVIDDLNNQLNGAMAELNDAQTAIETAQGDIAGSDTAFSETMLKLFAASIKVAGLKNEIVAAQNDLIQARQDYLAALMAYLSCVEDVKFCHDLYGCPPYVAPDAIDGGQQSGADMPAGQGTDTGEEAVESLCPCEDCSVYYDALVDALGTMSDAGEAITEAQTALDEAKAIVDEFGAKLEDAQSLFEAARESYNQALKASSERLDTSGWDAVIKNCKTRMEEMEARLTMAREAFDQGMILAAIAYGNLLTAQSQYDEAVILAVTAQYAYDDCQRRLANCIEQNGCEPEEGTSPDPFGLPDSPLPGIPGPTNPDGNSEGNPAPPK
jgi:hypothetical protein